MNITSSSINDFIQETKQKYLKNNIDPFSPPKFIVNSEEVQRKQEEYVDIVNIVSLFMKKFLNSRKDLPMLVGVTDQNGCFLHLVGDKTMLHKVHHLGIQKGTQVEEDLSSIRLAIQFQCPVELIGTQHYHQLLQFSACYSAPFYDMENRQLLGTIGIMTTVDYATPYLLAMLTMFIDSIERELVLRRENAKLQQVNEQLHQLALTDGLTGIPNRRCFDQFIMNVCEKNNTSNPLSLILFDIDHFKLYNDSYGHHVGDECLKAIGKTLIHIFREQNVLAARYGGEEFAVLLPNADLEKAIHGAEKIQFELQALQIPGTTKTVTISAGVATTSMNNWRTLLAFADKALYLAKQKGRNRIHSISSFDRQNKGD
jgi:diguanylate cyclase (GGDEF)-like protein